MGSLFKYYRETRDQDGDPLFWPGGPGGYPFRGSQPPVTKQEEYDNLKLGAKFRCHIFDLSNATDLAEYMKVRDKCTNGMYAVMDRDKQWDSETKNYRVYLEWVELGYDVPPPSGALKDVAKPSDSLIIPYSQLAGLNKNWF